MLSLACPSEPTCAAETSPIGDTEALSRPPSQFSFQDGGRSNSLDIASPRRCRNSTCGLETFGHTRLSCNDITAHQHRQQLITAVQPAACLLSNSFCVCFWVFPLVFGWFLSCWDDAVCVVGECEFCQCDVLRSTVPFPMTSLVTSYKTGNYVSSFSLTTVTTHPGSAPTGVSEPHCTFRTNSWCGRTDSYRS